MKASKLKQLSASLEDYLEAIYNLSGENNVARSKDIAESLGVSRASVTGALRLLKEKELANYKPYGFISLTESGKKAASEVAVKHEILKSFFADILGVEREISQKAACKAEHALGPEIIERLLLFKEFLTQNGSGSKGFLEEFMIFCQEKKNRGG